MSVFAGFCCHRRFQRSRRPRSEVLQRSGNGHSRRHHPGEAFDRSGAQGLLGEQDRKATHCAVQGDWPLWKRSRETDSCSEGNRHRQRSGAKEAAAHGWDRRLLHVSQWADSHSWKFW